MIMENDGRNEQGQFVKGRIETAEEKLKRSRALSESWKNREDYIGDIKSECPKIFNSWRAIRYTEKGKKIGNSPEWNDFRNFYNDVRPTYQEGLVFRRKDTSKIFSKENFVWVTPSESGDMQKNTVQIEYQGKTYTLKQLSKEFGIPESSIKNRYFKHKNEYTIEEIIFGKKIKRGSKPIKDYTESNTNIRTKASKMVSAYKHKDKTLGFENTCDIDIDWMINKIITQKCTYCGDTKRIGCDRIDNAKPHTKDNVVPCCYECNCARNNNFTHEEMFILGNTIKQIKEQRNKT